MTAGTEVAQFLEALGGLPGVAIAAPAPARELDRVEAFAGVRLPAGHRAFLSTANGLAACWGYGRLFGVGDGVQDIGPWNAHETWKFAWPESLDDFLAFGQTGWGDQFAYRLSDLRRGVETVYSLDRLVMETAEEPIASDFATFLRDFAARAASPDERIHEARRQVGELRPNELAVFWPSPLIVGLERAAQLTPMSARDAMVMGGDLDSQLREAGNETRQIDGFERYIDHRGRHRLRVRWAGPPRLSPEAVAMLDEYGV